MFLFTIKSRLNPKSKVERECPDTNIGGAYINCYISFKDFDAAEQLAKLLIKARGWVPEKRSDAWTIKKGKLRTKRERQYYAEAIKYGYCLVFHTWPNDAPDADSKHETKSKRKTRLPRSRSNKALQLTARQHVSQVTYFLQLEC